MANATQNELMAQRDRQIWELRMRCRSHEQIAQELGLERSSVSKILKRIRTEMTKALEQETKERRDEQTQQLLFIAGEAWKAWERSQQDSEIRIIRTVRKQILSGEHGQEGSRPIADPFSETTTEERIIKRQTGITTYLREVREALTAVRAIWGLESAKKADDEAEKEWPKALIGIDIDAI